MKNSRLRPFLSLGALTILAGCSTMSDMAFWDSTKDTETTETAAADQQALSPLEAHMQARAQVNPDDLAPHHQYAQRVSTPKDPAVYEALRLASGDTPPETATAAQPQPVSSLTIVNQAPAAGASLSQKAEAQAQTPQDMARIQPAAGTPATADVTGLRFGEHEGKTRMVFDLSGPAAYTQTLDNEKNLLIIDMPSAGWTPPADKVFEGHSLLEAYVARPSPTGGTMLAMKLKKPSRVIMASSYEPEGGKGYRFVLDLADE
ncbi:MAG: hypothetical protein K9G62_04710 [Alphaproteobacteria bacterium]|nr:hypothetical protein [Alphaproteobacteria bacterium]